MKMKLAAMAAIGFAAFVSATQAAQAAVTTVEYDITATASRIYPDPVKIDLLLTFDPSTTSVYPINSGYLLSNNTGIVNGLEAAHPGIFVGGTYYGATFSDDQISHQLDIIVGGLTFTIYDANTSDPIFGGIYFNEYPPNEQYIFAPTFGSVTASIVSAAPEPTTWALMLLGVGFAGGALRLRSRDPSGLVSI